MLKFRGYSRFIWDLIQRLAHQHTTRECCVFSGTSSVQHSNTRTWSQHSDLKFAQKGILDPHAKWRNKTNFCTQSNTEARRLYRLFLRRSENLHHYSAFFSSPNVPSNTCFEKHAQWSLIRTDTQRGVVSGLSQNRNLRSKIWWFTEFCNSHYVSHFAAFFIVTGAKISIVNSCFLFTLYSYFKTQARWRRKISQSSLGFFIPLQVKKKKCKQGGCFSILPGGRTKIGPSISVTKSLMEKAIVHRGVEKFGKLLMILPQVHLRKPCYDFYFL